jgi:hypothetical protein
MEPTRLAVCGIIGDPARGSFEALSLLSETSNQVDHELG